MNTRQEKLFWEAVGFSKKRRWFPGYLRLEDEYNCDRDDMIRRVVIISPDNEVFDYSSSYWPDQNAHNYFKYVIPAIIKKQGNQISIYHLSIFHPKNYNSKEFIKNAYRIAYEVLCGN